MSHFYGSIPVSSRRTTATACATVKTGLEVTAASHAGAVTVRMFRNADTGRDEFRVLQDQWCGVGEHALIAHGVVGEACGFAGNVAALRKALVAVRDLAASYDGGDLAEYYVADAPYTDIVETCDRVLADW